MQLDRALHHLAVADTSEASVAVEHFDDVAVLRDGKLVVSEQDKHSTRAAAIILGDRSPALWRTLQIWLRLRETPEGAHCERHLFFVNHWVDAPIAGLLKDRRAKSIDPGVILEVLRKAGVKKTGAKIEDVIADVLSRNDETLLQLIGAIEVVVAGDHVAERVIIANGLGLDPRADKEDILDGLLGWLTTKVRLEWAERRPALITRSEILIHARTLEDKQRKSSFLPRASAEIPISDEERQGALTRNFVEHLSRITAEQEDVVQAIDHFLKFNIEKHRLVRAGDVPIKEWGNRSERLRERWRSIFRRRRREMQGSTVGQVGQAILADVTYDHRESIDGQPCDEIYMTSGNYHRLAEGDEVWWDPEFTPGGNGAD
ncbi:ABC-three component system protein [Caulobacter segnis]|uniref:ABC-three component system protein n=1 Tax=Caulobacter segnis TaxID=88688 RepID=UPI0026955A19|nr:ABC-three component system protein [Caulobacter segnis]